LTQIDISFIAEGGAWRKTKDIPMKRALIPGLILILIGLLAMTWCPILTAVGEHLILYDPLQPADIIHVIAGRDARTRYGIQLLQEGYGKTLFFTGGWCVEFSHYHGAYSREMATAAGIPPTSIAIDDSPVKSTYDEVLLLKKFIDSSPTPIRSVIVVSDPYHMRRAKWAYQKILGDKILILMAPVPFGATYQVQNWWQDAQTRKDVLDEYGKLVYYWLRYQVAWKPLSTWLASLDKQ
jgi:uncharacterized SAM-binding protein YcdF (DUF218 family)